MLAYDVLPLQVVDRLYTHGQHLLEAYLCVLEQRYLST